MESLYPYIKLVHMSCVGLSGLGFILRGLWCLTGHPRPQGWLRWLPHGVDALLLGSAITLAVLLGVAPLRDGWLTAKLLGLIAYILLGAAVLGLAQAQPPRRTGAWTCFLLALAVFAYIVSVAITKQVMPWR